MKHLHSTAASCLVSLFLLGCGSPAAPEKPPTAPAAQKPAKDEHPGLHNLLKVSDRIYSGSEPHGEEGFETLAAMGVKTVVSVDGARPNIEAAHKHGMRYVHIPIGYDGVPKEAGAALAHLVREVQGPIYVHCHHGQHRGPAAAAVACTADGGAQGKPALGTLEKAGTGKQYAGLWRDVEAYTPPAVDATLPELVEIAQVDSLAAAMAKIDRNFDNLKLVQAAKWKTPRDHPDLVPVQEIVVLRETLHEANRTMVADRDPQFKTWLLDAEALAKSLEDAILSDITDELTPRFQKLEASCKQCHGKYRN
jgi:protein tyrosine phosphatase (PTP) superfamily phosphohydrolase (DUF442 family)/cytochrome c556